MQTLSEYKYSSATARLASYSDSNSNSFFDYLTSAYTCNNWFCGMKTHAKVTKTLSDN